ncbi:PREDICTED: ets DNA-binding protein pokkuri [Nicrophorus vespilloides]|uniref:Ets DNA-binding protein pokkuri n=1 Tax=Nicrophorus vespilloides TaxID=110193 RepID=A0ABM1MJF5_NICVS|nr:PREDICTED: ets DNA-binding protein pokkuri [Nicrophorus vespilloides]
MKLVPGPLPPIPTGAGMDRLPLPLPFSPDLLWRYPLSFPLHHQQPPSSPLMDYKSQLPSSLASDPRIWSRDDVISFLRWSEREFDLQPFDMDMFQMNGKAISLLTRTDLSERAPGSGDVLHNVLQLLIREANNMQRVLPSSPVTPTSRHPYPLSPHSHPPTPNWSLLQNTNEAFHPHAAQIAAHIMAQSNSVTLSPAPSVDSQAGGSPQHAENNAPPHLFTHSIFGGSSGGSNGSGSNQSDSDEDYSDKMGQNMSPPNTPSAYSLMHPNIPHFAPRSPKEVKREFFPNESPEPNTNGRLLWDFLQQLLNDPSQRYTNYIAWKNHETGVFKIVDPAGLAKLWGIQKNHLSMNYDKMSRALRYYYRVNILRKVQGERHCYQFLRNPTELKNIKNISLLRQQMSPTRPSPMTHQVAPQQQQQHPQVKPEPVQLKQESPAHSEPIKPEPIESEINVHSNIPAHSVSVHSNMNMHNNTRVYEDKPTDLSMEGPTDLSISSNHVNIVCSPDTPNLREPMNYYMKDDEK